jgi:hypothetical protein
MQSAADIGLRAAYHAHSEKPSPIFSTPATADYSISLYALGRFRCGPGAGFGLCRRSARILAICAVIGLPPCSPISINTSAVLHSALFNRRLGRRSGAGDSAGLSSLGWDQRGLRSSTGRRYRGPLSHYDEPVGLYGRLQPSGRWHLRWPLSAWRQRGRLSARQVCFSFAWNAGSLVWADR